MLLCTLRLASQNYASQSFAPAGAKKFKIIFRRDLCVAKNSSQPANVNFGSEAAKTLRCSRLQILSSIETGFAGFHA